MYKAVVGFAVGLFLCGFISGSHAAIEWEDLYPCEDVSYLAVDETDIDEWCGVNGYWDDCMEAK
jgi:hypothetical protein